MPLLASSTTTTSNKNKTAKTLDGRLLCASTLTYEIREPYLSGAGFLSPPKQINKGVNSCLIGPTRDGIVIAFRGTTNGAWDMLQNTSAKLIPARIPSNKNDIKGRVHKGFYTALFKTGFAQEVQKALKLELSLSQKRSSSNYKNNKKSKIYLTGHSKGGALASLYAALELVPNPELPNPTRVVTFGSPRLGDSVFAKYFQQTANVQQTTYENHLDIIPFLPPSPSSKEMMTSFMENVQKEKQPSCKRGSSCPAAKKWEYAPIGDRKFLSPGGQIVDNVNQELDLRRIREFEAKTILKLGEFRQAHCSSCPSMDNNTSNGKNGCYGGYFKAIAPEICQAVSLSS